METKMSTPSLQELQNQDLLDLFKRIIQMNHYEASYEFDDVRSQLSELGVTTWEVVAELEGRMRPDSTD
jgi:hypothetical protein